MSLASLYRDHLNEVGRRTDRALEDAGFDAIAIHSGTPPVRFLDDQSYPFVPNPHFRAWVPLSAPQSWVIHRPGRRPTIVFYQPADYWHSTPQMPAEHWVEDVDLITVDAPAAAREQLPGGRIAVIGDPAAIPDWGFAAVNPSSLLAALHFERAVKTPYEIECMRRASAAGVRGHTAAAEAFQSGASEFEIHLAYLRATGQTEADLPYSNIIALNEHAAVLHHTVLDSDAPADRRSFLIDAGAASRGYACDITRTHTTADGAFADLISAVDALQQQLCDRVRPGTDYVDIHLAAHEGLAGILRDAGIIDLAPADAVASGLSAVFFPHGIGHLIGLQVHDVAGLAVDRKGTERPRPAGHPYLRLTRTLEPGFVVTIEPGLYFIPLLLDEARRNGHRAHIDWAVVERLAPYGGVRIEDDVVCTTAEPENLTRNAWQALKDAPHRQSGPAAR
ncbi:MAG TPA: Xaa-Pro dipeptidase [Steroidobacteraceae bacterium]|nr:Xaa-Pro dipeptidase [Steroidobacteraceae bacterium]